jgi:hypothetical protein
MVRIYLQVIQQGWKQVLLNIFQRGLALIGCNIPPIYYVILVNIRCGKPVDKNFALILGQTCLEKVE